MKFSERAGIIPVSSIIQTGTISPQLRNSIWNVLYSNVFDTEGFTWGRVRGPEPGIKRFSAKLWAEYFKLPIDTRPHEGYKILEYVRDHFFKADWFKVYDFVEFVVEYRSSATLRDALNVVLERELAGYRLIGNQVAEITDPSEVRVLETVLSDDRFASVNAHLRRALELLSDRENPDYRNSIKESISAVESLAQTITGQPKATLGDAMKVLKKGGRLHPALSDGFSKLYGYTSDAGGVRHAMLDEPTLTAADAKYFLLSCTSFVNYLKSLA